MKKITSFWQIVALNAYWVGLSFKWNALHPIVLPALVAYFTPPALKNTYLGLLTFAGLVVATVIQPFSGALSDGWRSRWGRRRPLIVIGTLCEIAFLVMIGRAGGLFWLAAGYIGLQVFSNLAHGPAQGLLPDRVARQKLGLASGLKTFMDMMALVIASLAAGRLLDPQGHDASLIMGVVIVLALVFAAITVFGTPEEPTVQALEREKTGWRAQFRVDFRANAGYWWLIGQRFAFMLGITAVQSFAQYYLQDVLQVENPAKQTGDLLAALTLSLVFFAVAGGWLADRFGAKRVLYAAGVISTIGYLMLRFAATPAALLAFGSVLGVGIGLFLTANWALATRLAPAEEAGKFLGLTNLATAGAGALARLEGPIIDAANSAAPGMWIGYTGMFVFGAICAIGSMILLAKIELRQ